MSRYSRILDRCFVNVPFDRLRREYLPTVLEHRIRPEIGLVGDILYDCSEEEFAAVAAILKKEELSCTLHAPFTDLMPGASDREILRASRAKLRRAFALIPVFEPAAVVCHLGYEANKHGNKQDKWFRIALETWQELLEIAARYRTPLMLENTYEADHLVHRRMLAALDSEFARFCFDTGHVLAFAGNTWQDWLPAMEPWLGQLHLHDNEGADDAHRAIGRGRFDFSGLFAYLKERRLTPIVTLEPHTEPDLWESLPALDRLGLFD